MPEKGPEDTTEHLTTIRRFFVVFLPFLAILLAGIAAHYYVVSKTERVLRESSELLNVGLARSALNTDLANVVTDLGFLANHLEEMVITGSGSWEEEGAKLFSTFIVQKKLYDQIRFLDTVGHERIRVNFRNGQPYQVGETGLQDKSTRYYFTEATQLGRGDIYISPLDLNVELGEVQEPTKPMMRFVMPVFGHEGGRHGYLVLNYLGERMLGHFSRAAANISDHIHLLNADGYWLRGPERRNDWGFMLLHGKNFKTEYPKSWRRISRSVSGQFRTDEGLFTFETVTPAQVAVQVRNAMQPASFGIGDSQRWKVVAHVSPQRDAFTPWQFFMRNYPLYLATLAILIVVSLLLAVANERHHRAELQSAYERRFRRTLEDMEMAAVSIDRQARLTFCNDYFLRLSGWNREEVLGEDWIERFVVPERHDQLRETVAQLDSDTPFPRDVEGEIVISDGSRRLIAWHNTPIVDANGAVTGVTAIGEDITEKRLAEEKVRRLSQTVEQSPSIVMLTDRHGNIEYVNPKFAEVTGYSAQEAIGRNPRFLKSGETTSEVYADLWRTVLAGDVWRGEFHNSRKNGELYWEAATISALRTPDGEITDVIAVKEDITERKRLEAEIEEHNRALAKNQALAAMGRMASMIAHDLRNPLSSVKMAMQILGKKPGEEERELGDIALDQIHYMENILTDMLDYARPELKRNKWISIDKLLDTTLSSLRKRINEAGARVSTRYQSGLPTVLADANKLRQLFSNLIVNAAQSIENMPQGSRDIFISAMLHLGESGTAIRIEICDNGPGLSKAEVEKLFEPFYTTRTKGTGLGLAIVRQIAEQHGGSVTLDERDGGGVCAMVMLPTYSATDTDEA